MLYSPQQHHRIATDWITDRPFSAIWQDCGMGKTGATLNAMQALMDRVEVASWLVIGTPRIAEKVWAAEARKWDQFRHLTSYCITAEDLPTMKVEVIRKGQKVKVAKLVNPRQLRANIYRLVRTYRFLTIHYDLVPRLVKLFGDDWPWDGVVLDESSMVKNHDTSRFKSLRRVRGHIDWIVELTGTPNPNGLEQLWSQVFLLDGGKRLGRTLTEFRDKFMEPARGLDGRELRSKDQIFKWAPRPGKADEIHALVSGICMSMSSEDWQTLPPRINNTIGIYLPPHVMDKYRELEEEYLVLLQSDDIIIEAATAASLRGKLRQWANGAVYDQDKLVHHLHDYKLDALDELVETSTGPILLAYEYQHDRARIKRRLGSKVVALDEDKFFEERWNAGEIQVGMMHPASGGHGLNIQDGGSIACWFSPPVDFELYYQYNKRLHRSGTKAESVVINHLVAVGTVDEDNLWLMEHKNGDVTALRDAVKYRAP